MKGRGEWSNVIGLHTILQKDEEKPSVQTQATTCDKTADFWTVTVLGDSRADLQVAVGLWHYNDSKTHFFLYSNSPEPGTHLVIKGPLQPLPLGSSYIVAVTVMCSSI